MFKEDVAGDAHGRSKSDEAIPLVVEVVACPHVAQVVCPSEEASPDAGVPLGGLSDELDAQVDNWASVLLVVAIAFLALRRTVAVAAVHAGRALEEVAAVVASPVLTFEAALVAVGA